MCCMLPGADNKMFIWNCGTGEALLEIETPDVVLSMSFNYDGTRFATTCKDKMMRVFNTRDGEMIAVRHLHCSASISTSVLY